MDENFEKKLLSFGEISKVQLSKILNTYPGPKDLWFEPEIIKPLERICGVKWLRANGVSKIYKLHSSNQLENGNMQFYMIFSSLTTFNIVIDLIRAQIETGNTTKNKFHIILVPKVLCVFENILEQLGLYGSVIKMYAFQWLPIHVDKRILSLEFPNFYKNIFVNKDYSLLTTYAKSLWHMFLVLGKPKLTLALGNISNYIVHQLSMMSDELRDTEKHDSSFSGVILMDRNIDYPSALLTPGTYTALLNEIYGKDDDNNIKYNAKYDGKFGIAQQKLSDSLTLDSKSDIVYNDIKNRYFTEVTAVLSALTKQLRNDGISSQEMALDEMKIYVKNKLHEDTTKKKCIINHLKASENIINVIGSKFEKQQSVEQNAIINRNKAANFAYLEEVLTTENNKISSLRLMCLMSLTQKLSDSDFKSFWNKYMLEFGYKYGYVHNNLVKAGFISELLDTNLSNKLTNISKSLTNNFYTNAYKLKQIPNDPDKIELKAPTSCSYVYSGSYSPLITVIAGMLISNVPIEEIKSKFQPLGQLGIHSTGQRLELRSLLVCVVGGISYAEIAAFSLLEELLQAKITIFSEKIITGNEIIHSLF